VHSFRQSISVQCVANFTSMQMSISVNNGAEGTLSTVVARQES